MAFHLRLLLLPVGKSDVTQNVFQHRNRRLANLFHGKNHEIQRKHVG